MVAKYERKLEMCTITCSVTETEMPKGWRSRQANQVIEIGIKVS